MLDTLEACDNFINAGFEEKQAKTLTKEIASAVNKGDLVTKEYLRAELLQTEKKLENKISDVKNELINTEKRLEEKINKNLLWMITTIIAMTGVIIAVLK